ncbi:MAG: DUF4325 domain-containing protein [Chitinophagaceae bacterium]|nr:DUF4325 domain-containing protein [Chitinophagaceae bacterium]
MVDRKLIVKYSSYTNSIVFPDRVSAGLLPDFAAAVKTWQSRKPENAVIFDFSSVRKAFANGMLGIIAIVTELRRQGTAIVIKLPKQSDALRFFFTTSWAHLLDPTLRDHYRHNNKHFVQHFGSFEEIPPIINHFMEIIMGHIQMPGDVLAALEWSITEICDNVINHAESKTGGFLQVIAYPQNDLVAFTVADAGKGILRSLREGFPELSNDLDAIKEAIKAGVTRNKDAGQGNGLAGTSRITVMTGGSLNILTGSGRLLLQQDKQTPTTFAGIREFEGTCISGQIVMSHDFSMVEALSFGPVPYEPYSIVDVKYQKQDEDTLYIKMAEQVEGAGTRAAGRALRIKVINLLIAKPNYPIRIDWQDINVVASSFADEFLGKLFVELGKKKFEALVQNSNLTEVVEHIINKAITERSATG